MAFLRNDRTSGWASTICGHDVVLRPPLLSDYGPWAELRAASRAHLTPWEPAWARDELTKAAFRRRLRFYDREARDDRGYAFFLFSTTDQVLIGGVTLSHVRRGVSQSAMIGYWIGAGQAGNGYMTRAVGVLLPFAFETLNLNRLEAATLPHNKPSIGVLERNGFQREGLLRDYLKINGSWRDHLLYSRLAKDVGATTSR